MFRLTKRTLGVAAIVAAVIAPAASYARVDPPLTPQQEHRIQAYQQTVASLFGPTPGGLAGPVVPAIPHRSFQWDDAGLGAGIMLMLFSAGTGAVAVVGRRRNDDNGAPVG